MTGYNTKRPSPQKTVPNFIQNCTPAALFTDVSSPGIRAKLHIQILIFRTQSNLHPKRPHQHNFFSEGKPSFFCSQRRPRLMERCCVVNMKFGTNGFFVFAGTTMQFSLYNVITQYYGGGKLLLVI